MFDKIKRIFLTKVKKYFFSVLGFIFPARLIATFFGIGYLPDWQHHWTAFFVIPLVGLIIHFTIGFSSTMIEIAYLMLLIAIIMFIIGVIAIFIFQKTVFSENKYEVTIHVAFGQVLMIALSMPAIIQITSKIFVFNTFVCEKFMHCASWFFFSSTYFAGMLVPYFIFRLVDITKPWPSYWIERDYHNPISNMIEGLFNAIYATIFIYLLAFILFDLNVIQVMEFYEMLYQYVLYDINSIYEHKLALR
jgi:phosphatidylglycerophosphatase A